MENSKMNHRSKMIEQAERFLWRTVIVLLAVAMLIVGIQVANATERDHQTVKTEYVYLSKDNESAKYVIGGAILTCLALSAYHGRWCWEEKSPDPLPNPGPVPNDVTPDR